MTPASPAQPICSISKSVRVRTRRAMVVRKAIQMAETMRTPFVDLVGNMSYLYVPEIDKRINLFDKSKAEEMA